MDVVVRDYEDKDVFNDNEFYDLFNHYLEDASPKQLFDIQYHCETYLAKSKVFVLGAPVKLMHFWLSICLISSKTKSVYFRSSFISSLIFKLPAVSIDV